MLLPKKRNDKSKWLTSAGYSIDNWERLEADIRELALSNAAIPKENTEYGQLYEIIGELKGSNGNLLSVCTIWMAEYATGLTKFITMYPNKRKSTNEIRTI